VFDAAAATVPPAYVVLAILSAASMVVRFRRSRGIERQQLKWFTYGAVATMVGYVLSVLTGLVGLPPVLSWITGDIWLAAGPIAIGVAVLHYRLYDIDHLISRTVAYGLLTVLLGAVYAGLGLVLGQLFGGLRGSPPSWAVAGATLAVEPDHLDRLDHRRGEAGWQRGRCPRTTTTRRVAIIAKATTHSHQASRVAVRALTPPP
jgi:hypothetical protein